MVSALDSGSSSLGSSAGLYVVFLGKTLLLLSTQEYKWLPDKTLQGDLRWAWTSILSRGSSNTPSRFMLHCSGSVGYLGCTIPCLLWRARENAGSGQHLHSYWIQHCIELALFGG